MDRETTGTPPNRLGQGSLVRRSFRGQPCRSRVRLNQTHYPLVAFAFGRKVAVPGKDQRNDQRNRVDFSDLVRRVIQERQRTGSSGTLVRLAETHETLDMQLPRGVAGSNPVVRSQEGPFGPSFVPG